MIHKECRELIDCEPLGICCINRCAYNFTMLTMLRRIEEKKRRNTEKIKNKIPFINFDKHKKNKIVLIHYIFLKIAECKKQKRSLVIIM